MITYHILSIACAFGINGMPIDIKIINFPIFLSNPTHHLLGITLKVSGASSVRCTA